MSQPRPRKRGYRRHLKYVCVRPIQATSDTRIMPGEDIPDGMFRRAHMRNLCIRSSIGVKGDPWTAHMLERWAAKGGEIAGDPFSGDNVEGASVVHKGGGWFDVVVGDRTERIQGKREAEERAREMILEDQEANTSDTDPVVTLPGSRNRLLKRLAFMASQESPGDDKSEDIENQGPEVTNQESQPTLPGTDGEVSDQAGQI